MRYLFYILLFISLDSEAQTRFYLSSTATPALSPAFGIGGVTYNGTTGADRRSLQTTKDGSAMTTKTSQNAANGSFLMYLIRQYISAPLAGGQNIPNTVSITAQMRGLVNTTTNVTTRNIAWRVILVGSDGTTVRAELLSPANLSSTALTTTLTNRSGNTGGLNNSATTTAGDVIVVELYYFKTGTSTTSNAGISFGSDNGTDLPTDQTTTAANNPLYTDFYCKY